MHTLDMLKANGVDLGIGFPNGITYDPNSRQDTSKRKEPKKTINPIFNRYRYER